MKEREYTLCEETGKRCLLHEEAKRAVRSLRRTNSDHVHTYKCPHWRSHPRWPWHVGHNIPKGKP